ncbi:amidase signature enzyme [Xylariaceae sp. FL1019]|nr:amidase signature enzyme [Xylariaceae sp. FL1019]
MATIQIDTIKATAVQLQHLLSAGQLTSVQLVEHYLAQIERYEPTLNALVSIAPRDSLLCASATLDHERSQGHLRSPLHGIPIILKDCFVTDSKLGMNTCAGAAVFAGAKADKNAAIVQKLLDAGLIIMAKGNMTEFAGMKTSVMMPGWSAQGGQTISPYVGHIKKDEKLLGHSSPGGSSTGSAVSIAAGFTPLALGAETIGSIITPSVRAALYALKPTIGMQDTSGMYRMTEFYDVPGPMAKCASDLLDLAQVLLGRTLFDPGMESDPWAGLSLGFADPAKWCMADEICDQFEGTAEQMAEEYKSLISRLEKHTKEIKFPINVPELSGLALQNEHVLIPIAYWDFKNICIPEFIGNFRDCPVETLEDIIKFNQRHERAAMPEPYPEQDELMKASTFNQNHEDMTKLKQEFRALARNLLDEFFESEKVNLIIAPGDSSLCIHAAAAGYPLAAVPLGQLRYNNRPFGICILAKANREDLLLRFATAVEQYLPPRPLPSL